MNRKEFMHQCGFACLGVMGLSALTESCAVSRQLDASINDRSQMQVPLSVFITSSKNNRQQFKRYIIVRNDRLNYPIVVYRNAENNYTALLLRCSHQYNELNVNGDLLTCPAHGSEFNAKGEVVHGPAEDKLRSFVTTVDAQNLFIHLV
ncbi:Rieske (2Fe-2S) protein [Olivibacter sp. 47]|uniref:Rieske (2Fe-2S) protein n=1 Tax=Olivibacter sp. 47 TaxID=3056486 RepID=UPI0025A42CBE|nr:Rieske (2Fe-2S) protein [Olivibacter sp. 47]MDM8172931.1 Rieske (2Fe-2S) protein [Olivibacter sp. 47]